MSGKEETVKINAPTGRFQVKIEGSDYVFSVDVVQAWILWEDYRDEHEKTEDGRKRPWIEVFADFMAEFTGRTDFTRSQAMAFHHWLNAESERVVRFFVPEPTSPTNAVSTVSISPTGK